MTTEEIPLHDVASPASNSASTTTTPSCTSSRKKKKTGTDEVLGLISKKLREDKEDDECDIVGKNIAAKLRKLSPEMKMYAEKVINDILFEAQLGNLSRYSSVTTPRPFTVLSQTSAFQVRKKLKQCILIC